VASSITFVILGQSSQGLFIQLQRLQQPLLLLILLTFISPSLKQETLMQRQLEIQSPF
jgi:hypothetical protein